MDDRKLSIVKQIAKDKGIDGEITESKAKGKRFAIKVDGKTINFGVWPYSGKGTFIDHKDEKLREAWQARHSKILLKDGSPAYKSKTSPDYYAWNLLW
jgi:hypothetical protein